MLAATAVYFVVLVPQLLGEQVGNGAENPGVIHQAAAQHTKIVLQVLSSVRMILQATNFPVIQTITLLAEGIVIHCVYP